MSFWCGEIPLDIRISNPFDIAVDKDVFVAGYVILSEGKVGGLFGSVEHFVVRSVRLIPK